MGNYVQTNRPLAVDTPLGKDKLLLVGFTGREALSELFQFQIDVMAENDRDVPFEKLLGQALTVHLALPTDKLRHFNGIVTRISEGSRDTNFTQYRLEVAPSVWLLTKRAQSRIFQHQSVPEILKAIFDGFDVTYEVRGSFAPRDYCVQYRETDFHFASRLMEEEGIYYFFKHTADGHKMVVANTSQSHCEVAEPGKVIYEKMGGGIRDEDRITQWERVQELRSGKYTLFDHCFELPHKHLEAQKEIQGSVAAGKITHQLKVAGNEKLEIYDYPGGYAQRFDGVDKGGADQPADLQKIFEDNTRTVAIRMQQEALPGLTFLGGSNCRHFASGHRFSLEGHFNANGPYVLTSVEHSAQLTGNYRSNSNGAGTESIYQNRFACIPLGLPYRPQRVNTKPTVQGSQTAVVVGPPGEEIFTDKYSRVKVQFHWDRQGKNDANSSCWIRVATSWAGKQWGFIQIPRIGQEVIVDFLEGDPDQPIIVGSVYNAEMMPPTKLPEEKVISGVKSNSTPGGGGYNQITLNDTKGKEEILVHAQYDMNTTVEHDMSDTVHNDRTITVNGTHTETIKKKTAITITEGDYSHDVATGTATYHVKSKLSEYYDDKQETLVGDTLDTIVKNNIAIVSTAGEILVDASKKITLHTGDSLIEMTSAGKITLHAKNIEIIGDVDIKQCAPKIEVGGDEILVSGGKITSAAQADHVIKGGLVKIN